nr:hypothetical protein Iba_chr01bCG8880 [Ipomoea batatas]
MLLQSSYSITLRCVLVMCGLIAREVAWSSCEVLAINVYRKFRESRSRLKAEDDGAGTSPVIVYVSFAGAQLERLSVGIEEVTWERRINGAKYVLSARNRFYVRGSTVAGWEQQLSFYSVQHEDSPEEPI